MLYFRRGFTLVEIIIVITVIGILIAAIAPAYTGYMSRGRDTARITDIDQLLKGHSSFLNDYDKYPDHDQGCVNQTAISKYTGGRDIKDPLSRADNICGDTRGYGYGSGSLPLSPNIFSLTAVMEQPQGGNYSTLPNLTGSITNPVEYNNAMTLTSKGAGKYYVRVP